MNKKFEIGDWVSDGVDIGQILSISKFYVEKYTYEYFMGKKVNEYEATLATIKVLCEYDGKLKNRNRIDSYNIEYFNLVNKEEKELIETIKKQYPEEYEKYIFYDQKKDIYSLTHICFNVNSSELDNLHKEINEIVRLLPDAFTFNEFMKKAKERDLSLDFKKAHSCQMGSGANFELRFVNHGNKVINKKRIYTNILSRALEL